MKKIGRRLVGEDPTEEHKLEKMRHHQRIAYALRISIESGNKVLSQY